MKLALILITSFLLSGCTEQAPIIPGHDSARAAVEAFIVDFWTHKDTTAVKRAFLPEFPTIYNGSPRQSGHEQQITDLLTWGSAYSEMKAEIEVFTFDGEFGAAATSWSAIHTGVAYGAEPSNCRIDWAVNYVFRFEEGRIAEYWETWDEGKFKEQLQNPKEDCYPSFRM